MAKKVLKKAEQGTSTSKLKPGQVTARRAYDMSDSLNKSAEQLSYVSGRISDRISSVRKDEARKKPAPTINMVGIGAAKKDSTLTGSKDMEKYTKEASKAANANREKANRLKSRADAAMSAAPKKKMGGMIKRADGSSSPRGLWDNIRANKGSGKKPTSAMLKQEKKIKAKKAKDGTNVAKSDTSRYNKKTDTQEINKPLNDVTVRPSFGQNFKSNMKNFMTTDSTDFPRERAKIKSTSNDTRKFGDNAEAKSNLRQRKQFSTVARVISAPVAAATSALGAGVDAVRNSAAKRKEIKAMSDKKKMGGKVAKKMAPKMMMKTKKK